MTRARSMPGSRSRGSGVRPAGMSDPMAVWDPIEWSAAYWNCCARSAEIWWTRHSGAGAIDARRNERWRSLLRLARDRSPFYRSQFHQLDVDGVAPGDLPVVTKRHLMAHFDEWATDPAVHLSAVQRFLADRKHIGERFLGRYLVWKSSGSSGVPGIFLQDSAAMAVYDALILSQLDVSQWSADYAARMLSGNRRAALVVATGDHFASIASWQRAQRVNLTLQAKTFSVLAPLSDLVRELNAYQPAFLASYPTVLCLLAQEQRAGRLHIAPASLWSGGECLAPGAHGAIEEAFGCPLTNEYGASECLSIGYECREGWMHVNADWVMLEPVDAEYRPVAAGEPSHTVLLTNLINRVQPIIRYDLGDSIVDNPDPCTCGNPLPCIRVQGRRDDVLVMHGRDGRAVALLPMALTTVIEDATDLHRFQLVQTGRDRLALRFEAESGEAQRHAWEAGAAALRRYLRAQGVDDVTVAFDPEPPSLQSPGGKLRVLAAGDDAATRH